MFASHTHGLSYSLFFERLLIDAVAIGVFAGWMYLKRHARKDLFMVFTCFNIGLFAVLSVISTSEIGVAVGFGLFGVLSIIRLRSEPFNNVELGYFFTALVLALVNGLSQSRLTITLLLDALVLLTVFVADHPRIHHGEHAEEIRWDHVVDDLDVLTAELESRLGARIIELRVIERDYVRDISRLVVRYVHRDRADRLPSASAG